MEKIPTREEILDKIERQKKIIAKYEHFYESSKAGRKIADYKKRITVLQDLLKGKKKKIEAKPSNGKDESLEGFYSQLSQVTDDIKKYKKKHGITKRARKSAVLRHLIHKISGKYIPLRIKKDGYWFDSDLYIVFHLMLKRAYLRGRIDEKHKLLLEKYNCGVCGKKITKKDISAADGRLCKKCLNESIP